MTEPTGRVVFRDGWRVYLRPLEESDMSLLTVWINDPEVTLNLGGSYPMSLTDEKRWYERLAERRQDDGVILGIVQKETDQLIGTVGLHRIHWINRVATTGYLIGRQDLWGQGLGTEANMLALAYSFGTLNLRKICAEVYSFNRRSKGLLLKCGYSQEGTLRAHIFRDGRYWDLDQYAVFAEDFWPVWEKFRASQE